MSPRSRSILPSRPTFSSLLLLVLLAALWLAGGASRADVLGQVVVRTVAWIVLVAGLLVGERPSLSRHRPVLFLLLAAIALAVLQTVPLPPALWQSLPGRAVFADAAALSGQAQPWRPWSIVPAATLNAAFSLVVPLVVFLLATGLKDTERAILPGLLLGFIVASTLVGLLQFSGGGFDNPLVNDTRGQVSATFANRNHFALFVAFGCVLAPVWVFLDGRRANWRGPVAIGLILLFAVTILASGSRAGMLVGALSLGLGLVLTRRAIRKELGRYPRWVFPALIAGIISMVVLVVLISFAAERAVSIERALTIDPGQDMRQRGLGTVVEMIRIYFPAGAGLGSFDPVFRMHEPFGLLKVTYFNHAHNDFLEIVLDAGVPGLVLLAVAISWWVWASMKVWRPGAPRIHTLPRLGSAMLLLVLIASAFDYPARTPLIMAVVVIAALWMGETGQRAETNPALPIKNQHL